MSKELENLRRGPVRFALIGGGMKEKLAQGCSVNICLESEIGTGSIAFSLKCGDGIIGVFLVFGGISSLMAIVLVLWFDNPKLDSIPGVVSSSGNNRSKWSQSIY
jgi:hypothetical protein